MLWVLFDQAASDVKTKGFVKGLICSFTSNNIVVVAEQIEDQKRCATTGI
ncbi:MAG: EAL domain-containing protein (putative c-di-GMP-specific phosphodiesterase class I) [Paraglaciecola sp.]|jgi:EAL domain-containing protein (putative c-di-GMP-specific phosphodiesterase class I)